MKRWWALFLWVVFAMPAVQTVQATEATQPPAGFYRGMTLVSALVEGERTLIPGRPAELLITPAGAFRLRVCATASSLLAVDGTLRPEAPGQWGGVGLAGLETVQLRVRGNQILVKIRQEATHTLLCRLQRVAPVPDRPEEWPALARRRGSPKGFTTGWWRGSCREGAAARDVHLELKDDGTFAGWVALDQVTVQSGHALSGRWVQTGGELRLQADPSGGVSFDFLRLERRPDNSWQGHAALNGLVGDPWHLKPVGRLGAPHAAGRTKDRSLAYLSGLWPAQPPPDKDRAAGFPLIIAADGNWVFSRAPDAEVWLPFPCRIARDGTITINERGRFGHLVALEHGTAGALVLRTLSPQLGPSQIGGDLAVLHLEQTLVPLQREEADLDGGHRTMMSILAEVHHE